MRRLTIKTLGAAAVAAALLAACGNAGSDSAATGPDEAGSGPVTLDFTWWGNDDRASRYEQAIALFEEQNPDITVNGNFSDFPNYWTARSTEAAGRSLPDVMQFDLSYIREYSENGHLLDLSPYLGEQIDVSGFDEALVQSGEVDGKQVGVPTSTNTMAMFVNSALIEQAGVEMLPEDYTWEDYNAWTQELSEAGLTTADGQKVYGGGDYTGTTWLFMQWLLQQGIEPFGEDGTFNFDEDDVREYLELTADLRGDGQLFPAERAVQIAPLDGFAKQEMATTFTWDNFLAGYIADSGLSEFDMLPLPTGEDGEKAMFFKPSQLLSAGANTEHPEEAALFIDFLLTDPEVGKIFGTSKGVPADQGQRDAMALEDGSVDAQVVAYEEAVAEHVTEPVPVPIKGYGSIEAEWLRLSQDLSYGVITIDEFVEQWFAEAKIATQ